MTMHKASHPRDDVDRPYVSRKEGGRGLTSIEDSVDESMQQLEDYTEKRSGRLITATRNNTDNTKINGTWKQKWEEKRLYRHIKRLTSVISHEKMWTWLRKGNIKRETESFLIAAQNNAIRTNHIKARSDKVQQNSRWRLCGDRDETINHISECNKLAQKEYKIRLTGWAKWSIGSWARNWSLTIRTKCINTTWHLSWRMRCTNSSGILRYKRIA